MAIGAAIAKAVWAAATYVWGYVGGYVIGAVVSYGISYAATALFGKDPKTANGSELGFDGSIKENITGANNPIPVLYGRRILGGTKVFTDVSGSSNKYLHTVLSLCEGEINSIENVYLDDILITNAKYSSRSWNYNHTGSDTQTVDASLNGLLPDKWTSNHRLQGVAYVYVRLLFNRDVFDHIPNITADVKGTKVYDPRTETTAWSDNPALCIRDYLTNARYGRGIPEAMIDDDAIIAAANYCEQQVTLKDPTGSTYNDNRYRCNGVINVDENSLDNIKKLLSSCRGMLVFSAGKYKLVIDKPETAGFTFDADNIVGKVTTSLGDKSVVFNRMRIRYFDEDLDWEYNVYSYDNETLRTDQDDGLIMEGELELPFTSEIVRAEQIAQMEVKRSRQSIVCSFDATLEAMQNDVGDVVNLTLPNNGWENKKFRVVNIGIKSEDSVSVSLKEYDDSVYNLDAWTPPSEPDTLTPGAYNYDPPNNVTATSGNTELLTAGDGTIISRIRLVWDAPENGYCTGYEVGSKLSTESAYTDFSTSETTHIFSPVQDGVNYDLRVRAVYFNGGKSAWVEINDHTVQGKSAVPDTPSGFAVSNEANNIKKFVWNEVTNADLRGYRIRYKSGSTGEWADMTALNTGSISGSPWELVIGATGEHRFGLVSIDTSGNESLPVYFNITLERVGGGTAPGDPTGLSASGTFRNIILEWTNPADVNFYAMEIWASLTNDLDDAAKIAETAAEVYIHQTDGAQTFYYWVRAINEFSEPSNFNAGQTAGTSGTSLDLITSNEVGSNEIITNAANIANAIITGAKIVDATIGSAKISDLSAAKLTAGTIGAQTIQLNGASSILQSSNFSSGSAGWQIKGDGNGEVENWWVRNATTAPTFYPSPGIFAGVVVVRAFFDSGATVYYTDDGTPPTDSDSVLPSGGIFITSNTILRMIAKKNGIYSQEVAGKYIVQHPMAERYYTGSWYAAKIYSPCADAAVDNVVSYSESQNSNPDTLSNDRFRERLTGYDNSDGALSFLRYQERLGWVNRFFWFRHASKNTDNDVGFFNDYVQLGPWYVFDANNLTSGKLFIGETGDWTSYTFTVASDPGDLIPVY